MNIFKQLCRTLVLSAVAVALSVGLMGCPPTDVPDDTPVVKGTFTDSRDGKTYGYVVINGKTWMAENMNYATGESWCYNDSNSYCNKYGRLYDWETAMMVCPAGWKLPSLEEWNDLVAVAGASRLKSTSGWNENNNGTDDYGFSALPSGWLNYEGSFRDNGINTFWWTSTEMTGEARAFRRSIVTSEYWMEDDSPKIEGFSVRCIKNDVR